MKSLRWLLAAALLVFAWNIWGYDLWAPDEPYFGEGAREMVVDGRWAVPHVNGVVTTDKPPLFFWLIAWVSLPLGTVTAWSARIPSILAGLAIVTLTVRLGRRWWGASEGLFAGALLTCNYMFWDKARTAQIDALLCLLILTAISAFEAWRAGDAEGKRAGLLFWLAASLAVLAKGPVGLLLPLGVMAFTLLVDRRLRRWREFAPLSGPLLFLALMAAWMTYATLGGGGEYSVWGAFREHVLDRAVHGMHHAQPFWYYAKALPVKLLPWTALVPGALWLAWKRREPCDRLLLVWCLFIVLFFSISTEKRDLYVLPTFPAFALLTGRLIASFRGESAPGLHRRWLTLPQGLQGLLLAVLGIGLSLIGAGVVGEDLASEVRRTGALPAVLLGLTLGATGLVVLVAALRGRGVFSVRASIVGSCLTYLVLATWLYPALDPVKSSRAFSERLLIATADYRENGGTIPSYGLSNLPEAFSFYTEGVYFEELEQPEQLAAHLGARTAAYAVVDEELLPTLPDPVRDRLRVIERARLSRKQVALVSNVLDSPTASP